MRSTIDAKAGRDPGPRPSAGVGTIASKGFAAVRKKPKIVAAYLIVALASLIGGTLTGFVDILVAGYAVVVAYRALGGEPAAERSFGVRLAIVFVANLIAGIAVVIGLLLLVVPGVYLLVRFRLVTAAVMLEDRGPVDALARSYELTEGHGWTVFGVVVLFGALGFLLVLLAGFEIGAFGGEGFTVATVEEASRVGGAVGALLVTPVAVSANAVMYQLYAGGESPGNEGS